MRVSLNTEKGATDRQLAHIFLWFITIFTECVSGTKAGDAKAHDCTLPGIFLFID